VGCDACCEDSQHRYGDGDVARSDYDELFAERRDLNEGFVLLFGAPVNLISETVGEVFDVFAPSGVKRGQRSYFVFIEREFEGDFFVLQQSVAGEQRLDVGQMILLVRGDAVGLQSRDEGIESLCLFIDYLEIFFDLVTH
jgi:hypothetical protein